jgi:hypothetical protein
MLLFCVNHLSPANELVYDTNLHRCYLVMMKNGSRSLNQLVKKDPNRFLYFVGNNSGAFLAQHNIAEITVFVRNPVERFFSGLMTQSQLYKFSINAVLDVWEGRGLSQQYDVRHISMFDGHTTPQFWNLLRATKPPGLKFNIVSLSQLSKIYPDSEKVNVGKKFDFSSVSIEIMNKIDYFLTEDVVLYNQFLNQITGIEPIIEKIKLETAFMEEYRSYYKTLTYL